ncbi:hypothetical protein Tco_1071758 [Tanacetum coccineum]
MMECLRNLSIPVEDGDSFWKNLNNSRGLKLFKFDIEEKILWQYTIHAVISLSDLECVCLSVSLIEEHLTSIDPGFLQQRQEQVVNLDSYTPKPSQCQKIPIYYDDDDDEESYIHLRDIIIYELPPCIAITLVLLTKEPDNSLSMGDKHLSTIPETESDELIKSSVENLVPIPSESEDLSDIERRSEGNLFESLFNRDTLIISSPKFDFLLEEFSGELTHIDLIPPGINEADFDPEEEIRHVEKLFDSLMEEIDIFLTPDDSMPPGIENDDYDSEGDILFLEEILSNDSPSLLENESFYFDIPLSPRPPVQPSDDGIYLEPDTGLLTTKVVGDISKHYVLMPRLLPTQPTLASNEEKSPHFLSHRGFKAFQLFF